MKKNKVIRSVATEVQNRSKSPCFSCLVGGQRVRANTGYDILTVQRVMSNLFPSTE